MLIAISGYLTTVLIDLIRWRICSFVDEPCAASPNPSRWLLGFRRPNPNFERNLSSFNTHTAFRHRRVASNKFHKVIAIFKGYRCKIAKLLPRHYYRTDCWFDLNRTEAILDDKLPSHFHIPLLFQHYLKV